MSTEIIYKDLGSIAYAEAWEYQEKLFSGIIDAKLSDANTPNYLLFCEHPQALQLNCFLT